jgi:hypothetical protein
MTPSACPVRASPLSLSPPHAYLRYYRQVVCCVPISFELADQRRRMGFWFRKKSEIGRIRFGQIMYLRLHFIDAVPQRLIT